MGRLLALAVRGLGLQRVGGGLVALVKAGTNLVPRCHRYFCRINDVGNFSLAHQGDQIGRFFAKSATFGGSLRFFEKMK